MEVREICLAHVKEISQLFNEIFSREPWNDEWNEEDLSIYMHDLVGNRLSLSIGLYDGDQLIGIALGRIKHWYNGREFWIDEFDIDGIRLDAADVLDFDFMRELRGFTSGLKEDFWLMGEVIHGDYSRWANGDMLDSVTNYELHKGLYSGHNDHNYFEIAHSVKRLLGICGDTRLYTFVDNHDVERIYSKVNNKEHLYNIYILLYTLYGIPSVYYGSEFAIEGKKENGSDWNLRPCLELDDFKGAYENNEITALCAKLGKLKKDYEVLSAGKYEELLLTNRQFAYSRSIDKKTVIVALNNDDNEAVLTINPRTECMGAKIILDGNNKAKNEEVEAKAENGNIIVKLPANYGTIIELS